MPWAQRILWISILFSVLVFGGATSARAVTYGDLGGDDYNLLEDWHIYRVSMDIADNGDIYVAGQQFYAPTNMAITVLRSQDGGTTWEVWGEMFTPPGNSENFTDPCLKVVEGVVDKCYLAYTHSSNLFTPRIMMVSSDLSDAAADFSAPVTVMSTPGSGYGRPRFDTDVVSFSSFNIYLVAESQSPGSDIYFTRSTDQGATFEIPYTIGNLAPTDRDYNHPDVSYGFGGYVNVAWQFTINDTTYDSALRYRRASSSAGSGLASWTSIYGLGSTTDGTAYNRPRIRAAASDSDVVIAFERRSAVKGAASIIDPGIYISTDSGATYPTLATIPDGVTILGEIVEHPATGNWFICGTVNYKSGIHRANASDLTSWSALETFVDQDYASQNDLRPSMALNPALAWRPAMSWISFDFTLDDILFFDAEWRGDPGYPNLEPGFPLQLDFEALSDPAVVDVTGDGDLEIVFGDTGGNIQIYRSDGTVLPGWPQYIGESLSDGPIAVGDLEGRGEMSIVAGSSSGRIYRYLASGQPAPGNWPFFNGDAGNAYVAIGAFGQGPYPRGIVAHMGKHAYFLDHKGNYYPDTFLRTMANNATHAPAIGDVDGDGLPDVAFSHQNAIAVTTIFDFQVIFGKYLADDISGALTMGDFDLDGDQEVVVPQVDGTLHVFDDDGQDIPGFPFVSPPGTALSTAAIGQLLGTAEPEIVTAARDYQVHLLWYDGYEGIGWPASTQGWANYTSPIIGRIDGSSSDVVMGTRGSQAWGWDNFGNVIPGWPKALDENVYQAPAMGDIDQDGSTEIVFLSSWHLTVVDINQTANDVTRTWAMAGHDPQRTGCSDCPEDIVTPVGDDQDAVTRISFAMPSPNPSSGPATFRFAVPTAAVVNLEVFDVRGHRVSLVTRKEVGMGNHMVSWSGTSDRGAPLASGVYFARLRVQGPGINQEMTRKITLAR